MKIAVLGSGHVGQTLARGLKGLGHDVIIGSREGNKLGAFVAEVGIREERFEPAAAGAELVIIAVKGGAAEELARALAAALAGKVVLDTTNPIAGEAKGGVIPYFTAAHESLLQRLQASAPQARFVKCWNSVGAHLMIKPKLSGGQPAMFICGDDAEAKGAAAQLLAQCGWAAEDVGTSAAGHAVEALCQLWCAPGFLRNDWAHAFAVLRP
ncbi:MAG: NAD(P)-binding domain-containing protein [Deltaproteobacteria bacterium]|nr:NAD(P)-binding domain-containing protein [Deltaproteobacteria bacterium]